MNRKKKKKKTISLPRLTNSTKLNNCFEIAFSISPPPSLLGAVGLFVANLFLLIVLLGVFLGPVVVVLLLGEEYNTKRKEREKKKIT